MSKNHVKDNPDKIVPHRGDIIVDSSALFGMLPAITASKGFPEEPSRGSYLEVLPFLAKNGYRIIIPEMVSFEAGKTMSSGFDISSLFGRSDRLWDVSDIKKLLKDAALPEGSAGKKNGNINILANTGPKEINDFCDDIKKVLAEENDKIAMTSKRQEQLKIRAETRHNVVEIVKGQQKKGMGDDAIISLLERDYKDERTGKPVFVLADDVPLSLRVEKLPNAKPVTTSELIYSLVHTGLGENVGFPADIDAHELERQRRIDCNTISNNKKTVPEEMHRNEHLHILRIKESPLAKSLAQLKEDLETGRKPGKESSHAQVEKERRRNNNDQEKDRGR